NSFGSVGPSSCRLTILERHRVRLQWAWRRLSYTTATTNPSMNANKRSTDISWRETKRTPKTPSEQAKRFGETKGLSRSSTRRTTVRIHAGGEYRDLF